MIKKTDSGPIRDYYRRNFLTLLRSVSDLYDDILNEEEKSYIETFSSLSSDAQCLYVRMVTRVGPLFRTDKLSYDEISDIPKAAHELASSGFANINAEHPHDLVLLLLLKAELVDLAGKLAPEIESPAKMKKIDLYEALAELEVGVEIREYVYRRFSVYEPLGSETLSVLQLLFFGNFRQDLSEFIVTDLGIVTYEDYPLSQGARPYRDRRTVDERIAMHVLAEELFENLREMSKEDILERASCLMDAVPDPDHDPEIRRRFDRICSELARQLERLDSGEEAAQLYKNAVLPPSRERRARLFYAAGDYEQSRSLCNSIVTDPYTEEESVFAIAFQRKISGKLGRPMPRQIPAGVVYQEYQLPVATPSSVEEYALQGFLDSGYRGYWTENQLWSSLFGLAFWDIIFLPVDGVFFNRYQRGPSDLFTEGFRLKRRAEIQERLKEISKGAFCKKDYVKRYDEKEGVACALVTWHRVTRDMVKTATNRVPAVHLAAIFERMARDLRANTSGLPDLVLFPPRKAGKHFKLDDGFAKPDDLGQPYVFVEVKGPGDQVQKNQKRWMEYFHQHEIPCRVFRMAPMD